MPARDKIKIAMHPASNGEREARPEKFEKLSPPVSRRTTPTTPNAPMSVIA
jgi:hypothetical protein